MLMALARLVMSESATPGEIDLRVADVLNGAFAGIGSQEGGILLGRLSLEQHGAAPLIAALVRLAETDDIHLASCITPGSVVIPVALAASANGFPSADRFNQAVAAGYAAGIRLGMAIGGARAMGAGVWPTMVAAPLMAAVAASVMRGADVEHVANAMAIALSGRGGRIGRPVGARTSRWLSFARAVAAGMEAEADAQAGIAGDLELISPSWLAAQSAAHIVDPDALLSEDGPGIAETGYKPFATARQGATAVAAFQQLLHDEQLVPDDIDHVLVEVPSANHALVSRVLDPADRLSTLSNAGYQLSAAAIEPDLLFDAARIGAPDGRILAFAERVEARPATDLDESWPHLWAGRVTVHVNGRAVRREITFLETDAGSPEVERVVRGKLARMSAHRPAHVDLGAGNCAGINVGGTIWRDLLATCESRRNELLTNAYH